METQRHETICFVCGQLLDPRVAVFSALGARHVMCVPYVWPGKERQESGDPVVDGD